MLYINLVKHYNISCLYYANHTQMIILALIFDHFGLCLGVVPQGVKSLPWQISWFSWDDIKA